MLKKIIRLNFLLIINQYKLKNVYKKKDQLYNDK